MKQDKSDFRVRRSLLTGMGAATVGLAAGTASAADGEWSATRADSDAWMDEPQVKHRVWIDTSYGLGGMEALHYANNILTANADVNDGSDDDYSMIICWRHYATALGYQDPIWEKYGEILSGAMGLTDYQTDKAFMVNPASLEGRMDLDNGGDTIAKMRGRNVKFALCNAATRWYSRYIAGETEGNASEIYDALVESAIPDSRFVHAGVFATTRAQEYGYSLLYAG